MKVLFDTNIVLDVLMDRMPFADAASDLFSKVEEGTLLGCVCGTTITTVYYLAAKVLGAAGARQEVGKLVDLFEIAPVNRTVLQSALTSGFADFEDAVIHAAACHVGADAIVTRDRKDYRKSRIPVYNSIELARILSTQ